VLAPGLYTTALVDRRCERQGFRVLHIPPSSEHTANVQFAETGAQRIGNSYKFVRGADYVIVTRDT